MVNLLMIAVAFIAAVGPITELVLRKEYIVHNNGGAVLITGANSGIGLHSCYEMAKNHPKVTFYCAARSKKAGDKIISDAPGKNVKSLILDVTKEDQINDAVKKIENEGTPLVGLINNAGYAEAGTFEFTETDRYRQNYEVNFFGVIALTKAVLPHIKKNKGRIVNIGSTVGISPTFPKFTAYASTKFALESLTVGLRRELSGFDIAVVMINPGVVATKFGENVKRLETEQEKLEATAYSHIFTKEYQEKVQDFVKKYADTPEETINAIDTAMFDKYPKTRYITANMGPMPSWLYIKINWLIPDRLADLL